MAGIRNVSFLPPCNLEALATASKDEIYAPFSTATYSTDEGMEEKILRASTHSKKKPLSRPRVPRVSGSSCDLEMTSLPGTLAKVHKIKCIENDRQCKKYGPRQAKSDLQNSSLEYMVHGGGGFMRIHIYVVHEAADVIYHEGKYSYCWRMVHRDEGRSLWHTKIQANDDKHSIRVGFDEPESHLKQAGNSGLVRLIMGVYSEDNKLLVSKLSPPIRVLFNNENRENDKITFTSIGRAKLPYGRRQSKEDKYIPGLKLGIKDHLPASPQLAVREDMRAWLNDSPISVTSDLPSNSSGNNHGAKFLEGVAPLELPWQFSTYSTFRLYEHELGGKRKREEDTDEWTCLAQELPLPLQPRRRPNSTETVI